MKHDEVARPLRVAVVGSGPAGFYLAGHLLSRDGVPAQVDVFERLAVPWGLVRHGVAPDHQTIKSVALVYEKIARRHGFRFLGNVEVGTDVTHGELAAAYHAVVYAVGAVRGHGLGIPGEALPGSHSAADFVSWYNGHPDHADRGFDLSSTTTAVVVGNGNVALDVARMLATDDAHLRRTDMADHGIDALSRSAMEEIIVLGRRGPAQSAFTDVELRELAERDGVDLVIDAPEETFVGSDPASTAQQRNADLLRSLRNARPKGSGKRVVLRFAASPTEVIGNGRVEGIRVARNALALEGDRVTARPTQDTRLIPAQLLISAVGFRSVPLPGVPFDEARGTLCNAQGRVVDPGTGDPIAGTYVAGWAKRGPSGVIGTNKRCAVQTAELLLADRGAGLLPEPRSTPEVLLSVLERRGVEVVHGTGWELLDSYEKGLGEAQGRPRVKVVRRADQLALALGRA
ncbi:FAD-dependent oxidoreductase [Streptomyces fuscichromogenes]|uniref:FAD-dependent oxidoreductase n=1 Tax=Streptomyces fuscichromogenes TaxID=1324013 RepID=UPI0038156486